MALHVVRLELNILDKVNIHLIFIKMCSYRLFDFGIYLERNNKIIFTWYKK